MAGPIAVDTPDYQRGVVSAQKLLAHVTGLQTSVIVGIPPNTETLVVTTFVHVVNQPVTVTGQTTGITYPSAPLYPNTVPGVWQTYWVDVSQAVDDEVEVQILGSSAFGWYVYADSGVHLIADVGGVRTLAGVPYTIPMAPSEAGGDRPPVELSLASGDLTGSGTMIAAPGAGSRLRIFALALAGHNAAGEVLVQNGSGGVTLLPLLGVGPAILPVPLTGYPLSVNTALYMTVPSYGALWSAYYTTENV